MMKKLLFLICLGFISAAAQSIFILDSGTSLEIGINTDFCADSISGNGILIVNGTFCGNPTEVETEDGLLMLTEYVLSQNYPNPFNPTTTIKYQIPVSAHVLLKVYDVLGNEVVTLADEYKPAGRYEVEFNAEGLSSGIYFYKLQVSEYFEIKKMILIR